MTKPKNDNGQSSEHKAGGLTYDELPQAVRDRFESKRVQKLSEEITWITNLGIKIRELRVQQGLSLEQLSELSDVPLASLTSIESGAGDQGPSCLVVMRIFRVFGMILTPVPHIFKSATARDGKEDN